MPDGIYRCGADGVPTFVEAGTPGEGGLHALLHTVIIRLLNLFTCRGALVGGMGQTYPGEPEGDGEESRTPHTLQPTPITASSGVECRAGQRFAGRKGVRISACLKLSLVPTQPDAGWQRAEFLLGRRPMDQAGPTI